MIGGWDQRERSWWQNHQIRREISLQPKLSCRFQASILSPGMPDTAHLSWKGAHRDSGHESFQHKEVQVSARVRTSCVRVSLSCVAVA